MDYTPLFVDDGGNYILRLKDGSVAFVNTLLGIVDYSDTEWTFLRFGLFHEINSFLPQETIEKLSYLLSRQNG